MSAWRRLRESPTFWSRDFGYALLLTAGTFWVASVDERIRDGSRAVLIVEVSLGVALLAVSLTALAILVAFLGETYVKLLRESVGIPIALRPYKTVAKVSGATTLVAVGSLFFWPSLLWWSQAALLALSSGLTVWALLGIIDLVRITAWHGELRSRMPEIREAAEEARRERQAHTA